MTRDEIEIQSANDTGCEVMCGIYIRSFPEIGIPLVIIHFNRISFINHPIWGTPIHLLPILKHHPDTLGSPPRTEIRARGNRQVHACRERRADGFPALLPLDGAKIEISCHLSQLPRVQENFWKLCVDDGSFCIPIPQSSDIYPIYCCFENSLLLRDLLTPKFLCLSQYLGCSPRNPPERFSAFPAAALMKFLTKDGAC